MKLSAVIGACLLAGAWFVVSLAYGGAASLMRSREAVSARPAA